MGQTHRDNVADSGFGGIDNRQYADNVTAVRSLDQIDSTFEIMAALIFGQTYKTFGLMAGDALEKGFLQRLIHKFRQEKFLLCRVFDQGSHPLKKVTAFRAEGFKKFTVCFIVDTDDLVFGDITVTADDLVFQRIMLLPEQDIVIFLPQLLPFGYFLGHIIVEGINKRFAIRAHDQRRIVFDPDITAVALAQAVDRFTGIKIVVQMFAESVDRIAHIFWMHTGRSVVTVNIINLLQRHSTQFGKAFRNKFRQHAPCLAVVTEHGDAAGQIADQCLVELFQFFSCMGNGHLAGDIVDIQQIGGDTLPVNIFSAYLTGSAVW